MKPLKQLVELLKNKRFLLTVLLAAVVAGYFWTQSRYPQLDHKALMGAETQIEAIGFDVIVEMPENPSVFQKIYVNSANWMWTNRKGMIFGVIFGAIMMNLLSFLSGLQLRSRFANSAIGIVIGAPLGLCVNCSTPVAHGLHESGARTETMLAAMMSSPTLNVIVLTMLFAMFPPWLAFMKIGMTLVFILGAIPLLTRFFESDRLSAEEAKTEILNSTLENQIDVPICHESPEDCEEPNENETFVQSAVWVVKNFFLNLWYLAKITVPLMILAGILGAVVVSIVPLDQLVRQLPDGRIMSWVSMFVLAVIVLFLPAPMTFDVIAAAVLYNAGMPVKYVAIILFTLGIFSVYPFMTIWRRISRQIAFGIFGVLIVLGVAMGVIANRYEIWDKYRQQKLVLEPFTNSGSALPLNKINREQQGIRAEELLPQLKTDALRGEPFAESGEINVSRIPFNAPRDGAQNENAPLMKRHNQREFGITEHENYSLLKLDYRYSVGRGIASGDVNRDGWTDFVITSDAGFALYLNRKGESFIQQRVEIPRLNDWLITSAALVDLNNDGWLDLWFTSLREGNFVIYSAEGLFLQENMKPVQNQPDAVLTGSTAFGDIDCDGKLDIFIGNVSALGKADAAIPFKSTRNVWLHQQESGFSMRNLAGPDGESLTSLLSDINGDGNLDLLIGNDMQTPDLIYLGDGKGGLRLITRADGLIPGTTNFTMSISSADLDNDLTPELFFGSVALRDKPGQKGASQRLTPQEICAELNDEGERLRCEQFYNFRQVAGHAMSPGEIWECKNLPTEDERNACIAYKIVQTAGVDYKNEKLCDSLPAGWEYFSFICRSHFAPIYLTPKEEENYLPQSKRVNVLLKQNESLVFEDKAVQFGLSESGWTWNAKFADLDNDGWQDLFVVNGWVRRIRTESNFFYRNLEGKGFDDITEQSGLASNLNTLSYTYLDIDNDGDLDIIVVPTVGALSVYINQSKPNQSIAFELRDGRRGNYYGIGSKIIINYGDGKRQMRELQASGGYLSFDAPVAYFGLGDEAMVKSVEIVWSTGEKSLLDKEFKTGARYVVTRRDDSP